MSPAPFLKESGITNESGFVDVDKYTLLLQEYIPGETLYEVIREIGILSTTDSQFYIASMILILEYFSSL